MCAMTNQTFQLLDNLDELNRCIQTHPAVLIWFTGPNCRVCSDLKPKVGEMITQQFPKLVTYQVDCAQAPEAAAQHQVFSVPTLQIFFEGQSFITKSRNFSMAELEDDLNRPYQLFFG